MAWPFFFEMRHILGLFLKGLEADFAPNPLASHSIEAPKLLVNVLAQVKRIDHCKELLELGDFVEIGSFAGQDSLERGLG